LVAGLEDPHAHLRAPWRVIDEAEAVIESPSVVDTHSVSCGGAATKQASKAAQKRDLTPRPFADGLKLCDQRKMLRSHVSHEEEPNAQCIGWDRAGSLDLRATHS
jgi:hypothetical protein